MLWKRKKYYSAAVTNFFFSSFFFFLELGLWLDYFAWLQTYYN